MPVETGRTPATHDFYRGVHKSLRMAMTSLMVRIGATDPADDAAVARVLGELRTQLSLSAHHLANEDHEIHTALEARAPGAAARLADAHEHHRDAFEGLECLARSVEQATAAARATALHRLYLEFSRFVAADLAHMAEEEQVVLPVLQALFSDTELMGIEDRIMSRVTPAEMVAMGRLLIPAATREERISMLSALRANGPAGAFDAILEQAARPALSAEEFSHLARGLGLMLAEAA